jgi:predicted Rossmann fold flavoprotein
MLGSRVKIAIVGGGASGMMAAISAARVLPGRDIAIFEKNDRLGRKLLATGNGRCNFSNRRCTWHEYGGQDTALVQEAFKAMSPEDTIGFFEKIGIFAREESEGRLYPYSEQAASINEALEAELKSLGVNVIFGKAITKVKKLGEGFRLILSDDKSYDAESLIVATGGKAGSQYGSTGDGYGIAKAFGHTLIAPKPILVQLISPDIPLGAYKGVRAKGTVTLLKNNNIMAREQGEIQFTESGISGICIFELSRYLDFENGDTFVSMDLFPEYTNTLLLEKLVQRKEYFADRPVYVFLDGIMHKKLTSAYIERWGINKSALLSTVTFEELQTLAEVLKDWRVLVKATKGWADAQATAGGINGKEVNSKTLESNLISGLYFAGEILDVDGRCGGWNLQWAWSSGFIAGLSAAERRKDAQNSSIKING